MIDRQLGEFGEQEVRARLERALIGAGVRFSGASDKGLDLLMQFEAPAPEPQPVHVAVQVKAGESYASSHGSRWRVLGLDESRFRQWTRSKVPVLFVWVRPTMPAECYRALIKRDSSREHFSIAKRAFVTPALRYDLWLEFAREAEPKVAAGELLRPPLSTGLREYAKGYYTEFLVGSTAVNPLLGNVSFTRNGWRHMTRRGRKSSDIHQSLMLLRAAKAAIENAAQFRGLRRLSHVVRGNWVVDTRLVALRGPILHFKKRAPADVVVVVYEQIRYPLHWAADVTLHGNVHRSATFYSIYEKTRTPSP